MLPESSQKKLNEGVVVSCGPGAVDTDGDVSLLTRTYLFVSHSLIIHLCKKFIYTPFYTFMYIHIMHILVYLFTFMY